MLVRRLKLAAVCLLQQETVHLQGTPFTVAGEHLNEHVRHIDAEVCGPTLRGQIEVPSLWQVRGRQG